ncbi:cobalt-factor II C(20)-methyltransferase [Pediococcus claussenii]|uniref:Precorrin-2 C20-methyltransferase n=1 Tax=Pediococcus claussenii (strain ATCC BAA-344 / DSM 14800 / JCM 18046 / KCTC 3811 / LMG 21948 / P06) TaxID=701521 RepID=G8PEK6_PEDCP|nr:cobalt-factor II C(20)-methyltransferase [Pediococcus claussenii]AEV95615.1 precorrin-2 C20-methyltransferase [Pediococcus claussenii ATCC BAA-344]ANZ69135.1 precorrin-2 C(20)-methyltransferase [Pediococcus claussenii]ANZ70952.1 precorrin-2 C(20)-methyltransferase [Pediococcus claussenii]KRN20152.1 cbiL protein [Pediococcus claussenii]
MSKLFGIGVGPGDPQLLTVKAIETIKLLDVLYTPTARNNKPSTAFRIADQYIPKEIDVKKRKFPMTNNWHEKRKSWNLIAQEMVTDVKQGKNVGFLTLGDPSVYSTFSYIQELVDDQIKIEIIAGISSFSQIAAISKMPLMLDDESLIVVPANTKQVHLEQLIEIGENIVVMKVAINYPKLFAFLKDSALLDQAYLISNASMETEQVINLQDCDGTEDLPYFTTMLIKKEGKDK